MRKQTFEELNEKSKKKKKQKERAVQISVDWFVQNQRFESI
jgi:hypothetical protein